MKTDSVRDLKAQLSDMTQMAKHRREEIDRLRLRLRGAEAFLRLFLRDAKDVNPGAVRAFLAEVAK